MPPKPQAAASESDPAIPPSPGCWVPIAGYHVVEQIIEQMRERIFTSFAPGDRLGTEYELAEAFGVSRLALRDAVRSLRTLGLIDVRVGIGGGLWVAQSDPRRLADAFAVQIHQLGVDWRDVIEGLTCIEPALAALAARRRTEEDLQLLRLLLEQHRATVDEHGADNRSASDFHVAIAASAANPTMLVAVKALRLNLDRLAQPPEVGHVGDEMVAAHEQILAAIEARDPDAAARLMEEHDALVGERRRPRPRPERV